MKLENITKEYEKSNKKINIFNNLNIEFKPGYFYAIIGKSGSGKSTLINILGLLDSFQKGKYSIDGINIENLDDEKLSRIRMEKIGMIFQDYYLNPRLTAYENIKIATLINKNIPKDRIHEIIMKYLKKLNIENRANHYPSELSGGEQQRVCIARALVNNPRYILADEPTGSLDSENVQIIIDILRKLCNEGKCVIMVTHDLTLINNADYVYNISDFKLLEKEYDIL